MRRWWMVAWLPALAMSVSAQETRPPKVVPVDGLDAVRARIEREGVRYDELRAHPSGALSLRVTGPGGAVTIYRTRSDAADSTVVVPGPGELNPIVLDVLRRYPTDGKHRYHWPKNGGWKGCTKDLEYRGTVFAKGDPQRRAYCCGLTFEVFLDAWRIWCRQNGRPWRITDLDVDGVRRLQRQWFGSAQDQSCLHTALVENGLGFRVTDWDDARPGDFAQLWRADGSGHSVILLDVVRDSDTVTGLRYWSTQGSTDGIGERTEWFDERGGRKRVLRDRIWVCRVGAAASSGFRR